MVVEMLLRLGPIADPSSYQYVGFGALEFVDFELIHRRLGITKMVSIEGKEGQIARCKANRPYNGIEILAGKSSDQLATIDWTRLSIVWLDYTTGINADLIADVEFLCRELLPGSVLITTINAHPDKELGKRRAQLVGAVGEERIPEKVNDNTLGGWGLATAQREILTAVAMAALSGRADGADWNQVLNIQYRDSARMQLLAGVIGAPALARTIEACTFGDLEFVRGTGDALTIDVPYLTPKEQRALNEQLPRGYRKRLSLPGVAKSEIDAYVAVYRWLGTAG
jgi:hypothetical protein